MSSPKSRSKTRRRVRMHTMASTKGHKESNKAENIEIAFALSIKSYPVWPCKVLLKHPNQKHCLVDFFGTNNWALITKENIYDYSEHFDKFKTEGMKSKHKDSFENALQEANDHFAQKQVETQKQVDKICSESEYDSSAIETEDEYVEALDVNDVIRKKYEPLYKNSESIKNYSVSKPKEAYTIRTNAIKKRKHGEGADEGGTSPKVSNVEENEQNESEHDEVATNTQAARKVIKIYLKRISRNDIEDLVARKVVELISCRSEIGEFRAKCDKFEESNEKWKKETETLQKMCQDLNTVIKRYIIDVRNKQDNPTTIKITRSFGLQVAADQRKHMPIMHVQHQQHSSGAEQQPAQVQCTSQYAQQAMLQKELPRPCIQRRAGTGIGGGNQLSNAVKLASQNNASLHQSSSTSLNKMNKNSPKQFQNTSTVVTPETEIITNGGAYTSNQSLPQYPLISSASSNSQKTVSSASNPIITTSSSKKGYLATRAAVVADASSIVTATPTQNNQFSIRSPTFSSAAIPQQVSAPSSSINVTIPNNITVSKPAAAATATVPTASNGLTCATAASNKVIDLVELSDEEDVITLLTPKQLQPPKTTPAHRSQPVQRKNATKLPVAKTVFNAFQPHLQQDKPQQTTNRIYAPNFLSR